MPRPLVLGNSQLLINYDRSYQIRDLYYPYVGQYNHVANEICKFGVFVDGKLVWTDDPTWNIEFRYLPGTLVGLTVLNNPSLGIRLLITESVDPVLPHHLRKIEITSTHEQIRTIKIVVHSDLRIQETDIGDTSLYHPEVDGLIHYKFNYAFLFGGRVEATGLNCYTTGLKLDTLSDAQDGILEGNAISQGAVESCYMLECNVSSSQPAFAETWMLISDSIQKSLDQFKSFPSNDLLNSFVTVSNPIQSREGLTAEQIWLCEQSKLIIQSQCDRGGAILAANDGDILETNRATYSFLWPRDGALVGLAMDAAEIPNINRQYQIFASKLLSKNQPYFLHKYSPDGCLGASWHPLVLDGERVIPFQQDETALTIYSMGQHFKQFPEANLMRTLYEKVVSIACNFMAEYRDSRGVPLPSWDLWEERRGVHCYTIATTIAAFKEAAWMATQLEITADISRWNTLASELTEILRTKFWNPKRAAFYRMLGDETMDSAILSVVLFGALPPLDPLAVMAVNTVDEILNDRKGIGGVSRYEGDYYFRKSEDFPGNPWIICTMWLAQVRMMQAQSRKELAVQANALDWVLHRAEKTGIMGEQFHPATGAPLSVSPLTWSHAEYVSCVCLFKKRWAELN